MGDSMSTIINATTTNGVVIQPDNSGSLVLQTNNGTTALTIDTSQNVTLAGTLAMSSSFLRNRIINGDMRIAQRGTSAISVSTDPTPRNYPVDRFFCSASGGGVYYTQQSSTVPTGFNNSIINTVTTADSSIAAGDVYYIAHAIEGFNMADLAWGTADAQTVTLSFWVRSSITGTFSGSIKNNAANRAYVFTYTINAANTWEKETITIAGDTSGTWETTTSAGAFIAWDLGSGTNFNGTASSWTAGNYLRASSATNWIATNGATFYITGVQLEQNTSATPFERRMYGQELANCKRYYQKTYEIGTALGTNTNTGAISVFYNGTYGAANGFRFETEMRASPTLTGYSVGGTSGQWSIIAGATNTVTFGDLGSKGMRYIQVTSGGSVGYEGHYSASAEL